MSELRAFGNRNASDEDIQYCRLHITTDEKWVCESCHHHQACIGFSMKDLHTLLCKKDRLKENN